MAGDAFVSAQSAIATGNQFANVEMTGKILTFSGNVVQGTADARCDITTLQGEGNTFNRPLLRKFAKVFGGDETACPDDPWAASASKLSAKASSTQALSAQALRADRARATADAVATLKAKTATVRARAHDAGRVKATH